MCGQNVHYILMKINSDGTVCEYLHSENCLLYILFLYLVLSTHYTQT